MGGTGLLNFCLSYSIWANYGSPRLLLNCFIFIFYFILIYLSVITPSGPTLGSPRLFF